MWCVYIVQCVDQTYYTGITNNLERRIKAHNSGKGARYTAQRKPVILVWHETVVDQGSAMKREIAVKRWPREKKYKLVQAFSLSQG